MAMSSQKLTRFTYRLRQDKNGDHYACFKKYNPRPSNGRGFLVSVSLQKS